MYIVWKLVDVILPDRRAFLHILDLVVEITYLHGRIIDKMPDTLTRLCAMA